MDGFLLTDAERDRFAQYLERTAASDAAMLEQMAKIMVPEVLIQKMKNEIVAARIVAAKLRGIETVSLSGGEK